MTVVLESSRPPIDLSEAGPGSFRRTRPKVLEALWVLVEVLVLRNPLQPSSRLRALALRSFGARVGTGVILRPGLRVKFPWLLGIGDRCWIGEDVWIHNQGRVDIESDVVVSQGTFVSTGSHDFQRSMDLVIEPVRIRRGAWVTSRCIVLRGVTIGENALVVPASTVVSDVPADAIAGGAPARRLRDRWTPAGAS